MTLLHKNSLGLDPNHFYHTAITELTDTWLSDINLNKPHVSLFIDFAKAFAVVSYNVPLMIFFFFFFKMNLYWLTAETLNVIKSFLPDRHQVVIKPSS